MLTPPSPSVRVDFIKDLQKQGALPKTLDWMDDDGEYRIHPSQRRCLCRARAHGRGCRIRSACVQVPGAVGTLGMRPGTAISSAPVFGQRESFAHCSIGHISFDELNVGTLNGSQFARIPRWFPDRADYDAEYPHFVVKREEKAVKKGGKGKTRGRAAADAEDEPSDDEDGAYVTEEEDEKLSPTVAGRTTTRMQAAKVSAGGKPVASRSVTPRAGAEFSASALPFLPLRS